ncbi:uncharacterized protein LOC119685578 [Teleopsis dalmanni]|uniref:uncharacterized protein LOC119685578 n=1 Tax=Teleopsis dalmanni TaxID=139649 RepID=UPI0018CE75EE|nr:uncharacterized protein LOC119685578 [Teleopsis dalmanni]
MIKLKLFIIFIFATILHESFGKVTWTYEFISVTINKSGTDYVDSDLKIIRISRGKYGVNGFVHFKQDTTDKWIANVTTLQSLSGNNNYKPTPFEVPTDTVHNIINGPYKRFVMKSLRNCTTNGVYFEGNFVPPLTKRRISVNKCNINTDDWPYLSSGVYKFILQLLQPQYTSWEFLIKITSNMTPS